MEIQPYCDEVSIGRTKMEHVDLSNMALSEERYRVYEEYINREQCEIQEHIKVCPELYDKLSINWNGTVSACCRDYDDYMIVGNIMEQNINEIFHNQKEDMYRRMLCNEEYDGLQLCSNCWEYIPLKR